MFSLLPISFASSLAHKTMAESTAATAPLTMEDDDTDLGDGGNASTLHGGGSQWQTVAPKPRRAQARARHRWDDACHYRTASLPLPVSGDGDA
jgi:EREBP-like factor